MITSTIWIDDINSNGLVVNS